MNPTYIAYGAGLTLLFLGSVFEHLNLIGMGAFIAIHSLYSIVVKGMK